MYNNYISEPLILGQSQKKSKPMTHNGHLQFCRKLCFLIQLTFKLGFNRNNSLDFINNWFNFINNWFNFFNNRFNLFVNFDDYFLNYLNFKFFNFFYYLLNFIRYLLDYFLLGYGFACFFNVFYKMQD